jgi:nitrate reductase NapE component
MMMPDNGDYDNSDVELEHRALLILLFVVFPVVTATIIWLAP